MAVDFAEGQPEVDPMRIGGFGYSNGGCLIARAAAEDERIRAFVLLAAYTNLSDQLHYAYHRRTPGMGYFAIAASIWSGVPVQDLDTVAALERMTPRPALMISGGRDSQIPVSMGEKLKSSIPGAEGILYREIGHLDFAGQGGAYYVGSLVEFFDRAFAHDSEWRAQ
jgi:dienelactone hydrolase